MAIDDRNKAGECETIIRTLLDAPEVGLTCEQIRTSTGWPIALVQARILDLGSKVGHAKVRVKGSEKATYYFLKVR